MLARRLPSICLALLNPVILFLFIILFGADSYQFWGDRYHYNLTNRYLFAQQRADIFLEPLWREETLSGNIWITSLNTTPLAVDILAGRIFGLSPLGIDVVGTLTLVIVASAGMYVYLRRALATTREAATVGGGLYGATAFWWSHLIGSPDVPMAVACLPVFLTIVHQIDGEVQRVRRDRLLTAVIMLALLYYWCALNGSQSTLPIVVPFIVAYGWFVCDARRSVAWIILALAVGVFLYSPFFWSYIEAAGLSHRSDGSGYYLHTSQFDPFQWVTQVKDIARRMAVGHNPYGIFYPVVLGALVWSVRVAGWRGEQRSVLRVLRFALGVAVAGLFGEMFHEMINIAKRSIPLLGGWNAVRLMHFSCFGLVVLASWMLDRAVFRPCPKVLDPRRRRLLRPAFMIAGTVGILQIAYSGYKMTQVPTAIYPQNLVLYTGLVVYAATVVGLVAGLYRELLREADCPSVRDDSRKGAVWAMCMVVLVALTTAIHSYRTGVLPPTVAFTQKPAEDLVMSYAQRYAVSQEVLAIKRINRSNGRVVDLTRPYSEYQCGAFLLCQDSVTRLPLAGLRTPEGYSTLYPSRYGKFIDFGINGGPKSIAHILRIHDTYQANFEALGLLDVEFVLAPSGAHLPGYAPVPDFQSDGKTLFASAGEGRAAPAFVSDGVRCFASDEEALQYIHRSSLHDLQARAVLVTTDADAATLCAREETRSPAKSLRIQTARGPDRVQVDVEGGGGGVLTLTDTYYPGWRVLVDGTEKALLRTYTTLRGVEIGPGPHRVEFIYDPRRFWLLLKLSIGLLGLLLLAASALWWHGRFLRDRKLAAQDAASE